MIYQAENFGNFMIYLVENTHENNYDKNKFVIVKFITLKLP